MLKEEEEEYIKLVRWAQQGPWDTCWTPEVEGFELVNGNIKPVIPTRPWKSKLIRLDTYNVSFIRPPVLKMRWFIAGKIHVLKRHCWNSN